MTTRMASTVVADYDEGIFIDGNAFPWAVGTDIEVVDDNGFVVGLRMTVFADSVRIVGGPDDGEPLTWNPDTTTAERVTRYAIECGFEPDAVQRDLLARMFAEEAK